MQVRIITECFFDTMLIEKTINATKQVWHRKGCNNVVVALKNEKIKDFFKIGVIDKDKNPLKYLNEFELHETEGFNFYWKADKCEVVIQISPPLEKWILGICKEEKIELGEIGLSENIYELRKHTKNAVVKETEELKKLCKLLISSENKKIVKLKNWMQHLIEKNNNFDINYIKNA